MLKNNPQISSTSNYLKKNQTPESLSWHCGGCFAYSRNIGMATSRARNCSISSWVIISDSGAAATASAGAEFLQSRFEKGLNQPREKAPPNASFIPSQPLIFSQVGFWFLSRSIPCKKRRVFGRLTLTEGIWAPSTAAHAELSTYSQAYAIPVWINNEDRHSALLTVSSPDLTAKPSHKIKFMDVMMYFGISCYWFLGYRDGFWKASVFGNMDIFLLGFLNPSKEWQNAVTT